MSQVADFYDEFSKAQAQTGINNRHLSILYHLEKSGLTSGSSVLEVGCGIGTVSELILRSLSSRGKLVAVDISPRSISLAQQRNAKYHNGTFRVLDLTRECLNEIFDVVVLPDVLEHVPEHLHRDLFNNLQKMLKDGGFIFIHIPHPKYLQRLVERKDPSLQVIDNPIHTDKLLATVYPLGFYLHSLASYSVYTTAEDYQMIILKKTAFDEKYDLKKRFFRLPFWQRILKRFHYLLRGFK